MNDMPGFGTGKETRDFNMEREPSCEESICNYASQMENPYCYQSHGRTVRISFQGEKSLESCLARYISGR